MKEALEQVSLFFSDKKHSLGEIIVDAIIKESHDLHAQISEHPTESGESFCDHVQLLPASLQIEGVITNTPNYLLMAQAFTSFTNFVKGESNDLAEQAFKQLEDIFAKRKPITISTSLKDYPNMVLENLSIERSSHTSKSLHFRVSAKQIRVVNQASIGIPKPKTANTKPKQNLGKQETKVASEATKSAVKNRSTLSSFKNLAGSLWK